MSFPWSTRMFVHINHRTNVHWIYKVGSLGSRDLAFWTLLQLPSPHLVISTIAFMVQVLKGSIPAFVLLSCLPSPILPAWAQKKVMHTNPWSATLFVIKPDKQWFHNARVTDATIWQRHDYILGDFEDLRSNWQSLQTHSSSIFDCRALLPGAKLVITGMWCTGSRSKESRTWNSSSSRI